MTDQGALERARADHEQLTAIRRMVDNLDPQSQLGCQQRFLLRLLDEAEDRLTAASEAYDTALQHAELLLLRHRDRLRSSSGADMKLAAHEIDTCAEAIRALPTPAQSEGE